MPDISTHDETHFNSDCFEYRPLCNVIYSPRVRRFENKTYRARICEHLLFAQYRILFLQCFEGNKFSSELFTVAHVSQTFNCLK